MYSSGWRFFKLADAFRVKLAPPGSRRAQALGESIALALRVKHALFDPVLRRIMPERFFPPPVEPPSMQLVLQDGAPLANATIHVIIERNPFLLPLDEAAVLAWAARQTCQGVQVVAWDSAKGVAETLTGDTRRWDARDVEALCHGLSGVFVCLACSDLLHKKKTIWKSIRSPWPVRSWPSRSMRAACSIGRYAICIEPCCRAAA